MNKPTSITEPQLWIDLPAATYCASKGPNTHGVCAIQAILKPGSVVGALIVEREGDLWPSVAVAHLDDPLVVYATVQAMKQELRSQFLLRVKVSRRWPFLKKSMPEITRCQAVIFCEKEGDQRPFLTAAGQNIWGSRVAFTHTVLGPLSNQETACVTFDLKRNHWLPIGASCGQRELLPTFDLAAQIWEHQTRLMGEIRDVSATRRCCAGKTYVDPDCSNFTGEDYVRMPFKLFDLRKSTLEGYRVA